jgi:hypothetical protein
MSWDDKFKYEPMSPSKIKIIMESYKNEQVYDYIKELYELINYQKNMINEQRVEIIAMKHKEAWKRYDVDKPPKSGNMSC